MSLVRIFGVGMAVTAALSIVTACGGKGDTAASSSSSKATSSTSTTPSSSAASTTSSAPPSGVAPLGDYTYLLLQASDVGIDVATTGPPTQNPGGIAGAGVTFTNPPRTRSIDDVVVVFTDPATAAQQAKERAQSFGKYVTGAPQPFEVGTNGLIAVGTSPDNSKSVTYVTFAEGRVGVDLEFDSPPNDPAPRDVVLDMANKQDQLVKDRLPS
ncbi:hypothetical protein BRW65_07775 [Mycobacterium paraffinicum]|uniref:DUF5642 domain-containing protein n=1 Tax=Mycobacterium paraffinicum TaxID=53378 RepID=A0A1Q4HY29_9MYCO|nr:hypothetical protein [Mycobacterium paraffinicum]OJZ74607.1 hypothetical protein BRW65_07775 [Mycobacterium paraffinicum]